MWLLPVSSYTASVYLALSTVKPYYERVPTYGLLAINHAYNEGKITFKEWLELSREWALKIIEQYDRETAQKLCPPVMPPYSQTVIE